MKAPIEKYISIIAFWIAQLAISIVCFQIGRWFTMYGDCEPLTINAFGLACAAGYLTVISKILYTDWD